MFMSAGGFGAAEELLMAAPSVVGFRDKFKSTAPYKARVGLARRRAPSICLL